MPYIYKITNKLNGKSYIGKTINSIEQRWVEHQKESLRERSEQRPLYSAINKYGSSEFSIIELEECSLEILEEREIFWIEYFGSFKNGYNATIGGDGKPYIDRNLVIETYEKTGNQAEASRLLGIDRGTIHSILKERNIVPLTTKEVHTKERGKMVNMYSLNKEYIRTFPSLSEAARFMVDNNLTKCKHTTIRTHISEACREKAKTAAKFIWKFA